MAIVLLILSGFVTAVVLGAILAIPAGFLFMLLLGAAHSHEAWIPAPGFAASYFLCLALGIAASRAATPSNNND